MKSEGLSLLSHKPSSSEPLLSNSYPHNGTNCLIGKSPFNINEVSFSIGPNNEYSAVVFFSLFR
jgi:hypothetical protein